jgi:uncharacterized protein YgiM (DUF1202 family)
MTMKAVLRVAGLLALIGLVSLAGALGEQAEVQVVIEGVSYVVGSDDMWISGYPMDAETVTVQTQIDGKRIYERWFPEGTEFAAKTLIFAEGGDAIPQMNLRRWPNLEHIVLPASVTEISTSDFYYAWGSLRALEVHPDNPAFQSIDGVLFTKDGRELAAFPPGVGDAYSVPEGVTRIRDGAFIACDTPKLARLTLPASLAEASVSCLPGYTSLKAVEVAASHPRYEARDGMLFLRETGALAYVPPGLGDSLRIPAGVTGAAPDAFSHNGWLKSLSMPLSFAKMEPYMFRQATSLESIALSPYQTEIPMGAFQECLALERAILPMSLETIGALAFNGCEKLREVYIPSSVRYIDPSAFDYASDDLVIYATRDTEGHAFALAKGRYWAEPGGTPVRLAVKRRPAAVINLPETGGEARLLESPSEGARAVAQYPNGTLVEVLGQEGAWRQVRVGPVSGYLRDDILQYTDELTSLIPYYGAVLHPDPWDETKDDWANEWPHVYTYPGLDAPRALSYDNPEVDVLFAIGPWIYVDSPSQHYGYMPISQCDIFRQDMGDGKRYGIVLNPKPTDRLHLREGADRSSDSLGRYFNGTQFEIIGETDNWFQVMLDGTTGYFLKEFVREVMPGVHWWELEPDPNG